MLEQADRGRNEPEHEVRAFPFHIFLTQGSRSIIRKVYILTQEIRAVCPLSIVAKSRKKWANEKGTSMTNHNDDIIGSL